MPSYSTEMYHNLLMLSFIALCICGMEYEEHIHHASVVPAHVAVYNQGIDIEDIQPHINEPLRHRTLINVIMDLFGIARR